MILVKRFALRLLSLILLLLALLVAAAGFLLGTEAGTATGLDWLQSISGGLVKAEHSQGHLLGHLELDELTIDWGSGEIQIVQLVFDWSPRTLLQRAFTIDELVASELRYVGKPAVDAPPPEPRHTPIELPRLATPVEIVIRRLEVMNVVITSSPEATPLLLGKTALAARWDHTGITLEQLEATGPSHSLTIRGQLDPMNDYALRLENRLQILLADDVSFGLQGLIEGNSQRLEVDQRLSGDARLHLSGALEQPLAEPSWSAMLNVEALPAKLFSEALPLVFSGQLESIGAWSGASLTGQLETVSAIKEFDQLHAQVDLELDLEQLNFKLRQFELSQRQQPMRLSLAGEASPDKALDIIGDWQALRWPLADEPMISSRRGQFSVKGQLSDYRIDVSADIAGHKIPPGQWQLRGSGDRRQLQVNSLNGQVLGGDLEIIGRLAWTPVVSWDLAATGRQIQTGEVLTDVDGTVNLAVTTQGSLGDTGPQARAVLQHLGGSLNGQALSGKGRFSYSAERTEIDRLAITLGDASLFADGVIGRQSDLQWAMTVPRLGRLLADAGGMLSTEGKLRGPQQAPRITGVARVKEIAYRDIGIEKLDLDIDLDLQDKHRSSVVLSGSSLAISEQVMDQLKLVFDGFIRDHSLTLAASHPQAAIELAAQGGYHSELWSGRLKRLELAAEPIGPWQLQQAVALSVGPSSAHADRFCLRRDNTHLCAQGEWQAQGQTKAGFELTALPLDWFEAYFPEAVHGLSGQLSAEGDLDQGPALKARLKARITPGELVLQGPREDVKLSHGGAELDLSTQGKGAAGSLRTSIAATTLAADIQLADLLQVSDRGRARLRGSVQLNAPDLAVVPLLIPAVSSIEGAIVANFDFGGRLAEPLLQGGAKLLAPRLELADIGLQITDTVIELDAANTRLLLGGSAISEGHIELTGELDLNADRDWPFTVNLMGKDFIAADLPNLQVLVSPNVKVERQAGTLALTGALEIPRADILIRDLPAGTRSASPDVVVLRNDGSVQATGKTTPLTTDISVTLGDEVHVSALGFNGFVGGELRLRGNTGKPLQATGDIRIDQGTFRAYGQRLDIERGLFSYTNSPIDNPGINVKATRDIGDVIVGVNALGTARRTTVTTFSSPAMSENDRISYLVVGKPSREGASLSLDRQVAKNLSVGINVDTKTGERAFVTRYRILRTLHTEVASSARSSTLDLFYTIERE